MKKDLFISYAWTSDAHVEWVRLLASHLDLVGYTVKIDEKIDYGSSLNGFMQDVVECEHVLLIVDDNYIERANNKPDSGVGVENKWLSSAFQSKPANWLSVMFINNPNRKVPAWLDKHNPKGFDFNSDFGNGNFPGSIQIDAVWRWIEGLPASRKHEVPIAVLRKRAARLERIDILRDPNNYSNPALIGSAFFRFKDYPAYSVGIGNHQFKIEFSPCADDSVYIYAAGNLKAVGLITNSDYDPRFVESFLTPGGNVIPVVGQKVVLLNHEGILCILSIDEVQREVNAREYVPHHVKFSYEILIND
ncbi:toll/interleukin-1 receptor domain-containing protein [Pantoea agglomerans]|uniref:toll/interleukin-1 receptor domain-containing protein n=1 Tax=Enterobacter agglomerans TaxID=549 RepID=UPI001F1CFA27|nr:toll/interleukin-1 receptor domain-containing protein [Pantoea agglomerans]UJL38417.1 TIR domain-containing protein [Pantoea agglomerans]